MTANELADELTKMFRGEEYDRLVHEIPDLLRQQQAENEKVNAEWVQAAMALGACVQENHSLKAEIEALKEKLDEAIDAEKDRRFE